MSEMLLRIPSSRLFKGEGENTIDEEEEEDQIDGFDKMNNIFQ